MSDECGRFYDRGYPHDYLFCYKEKGHEGKCDFEARKREKAFTFREGDSAGGYWAVIEQNGVAVASIYDPELVQEIVELLNWNRRKYGQASKG